MYFIIFFAKMPIDNPSKRQRCDAGPNGPKHPQLCGGDDFNPVKLFAKTIRAGNDTRCTNCSRPNSYQDTLLRSNAAGCDEKGNREFSQLLNNELDTNWSELMDGLVLNNVVASLVLGMLRLHNEHPEILDINAVDDGQYAWNIVDITRIAMTNRNILINALDMYMLEGNTNPDFTLLTCEDLLELLALIKDIPQLVEFLLEKHNNTLYVVHLYRSLGGPDGGDQVFAGELACKTVYELMRDRAIAQQQKQLEHQKQLEQLM